MKIKLYEKSLNLYYIYNKTQHRTRLQYFYEIQN